MVSYNLEIKTKLNKGLIIFVFILLLCSLAFTLFAVRSLKIQDKLEQYGKTTTGIVVDKRYKRLIHTRGYYIKYEFEVENGFNYTSGWSKISTKDNEHLNINSEILVKYLEEKPNINDPLNSLIHSRTSIESALIVLIALTAIPILLFIFGFLSDYIKYKKIKNKKIKIKMKTKKKNDSRIISGTFFTFEVRKVIID